MLDYRIEAGSRGCSALRYSPSGDYLAAVFSGDSNSLGGSGGNGSTTESRVVLFASAANYATLATFSGHHELVYEVGWDASSTEFVTCSADFTAKVWSVSACLEGNAPGSPGLVDENGDTIAANDGSLVPLPASVVLQHPCFVYTACFHPVSGSLTKNGASSRKASCSLSTAKKSGRSPSSAQSVSSEN